MGSGGWPVGPARSGGGGQLGRLARGGLFQSFFLFTVLSYYFFLFFIFLFYFILLIVVLENINTTPKLML